MSYPNSFLDAPLDVFGWPWHGRIESEDETGGIVRLPTGRTLPCAYNRAPNTFLWDIGMPSPGVVTDDPDEQWQTRAIIRASGTPGGSFTAYVYGGMRIGPDDHLPMYFDRIKVISKRIVVTPPASGSTFQVRLEISQGARLNFTFSAAQLGLQSGLPLGRLQVLFLDQSRNGRKCLFLLAPRDLFNQHYIRRSLVEFEIQEVDQSFTVVPRVVVSSAQCIIESDFTASYTGRPNSQLVRWNYSDGRFVILRGDEAGPPGATPSRVTVSDGTNTYELRTRYPVWGWYKEDSEVSVVYRKNVLHLEQNSSGSLGDVYQQNATDNETYVVTLESDGANTSLSCTRARRLSYSRQFSASSPWQGSQQNVGIFVEGDVVGFNYYDDKDQFGDGFDTLISEKPADPVLEPEYLVPIYTLAISNKIVSLSVSAQGTLYYGGAITPSGVDSGFYSISAFDPKTAVFRSGSYNPISGVTVRQQTDKYYSWV